MFPLVGSVYAAMAQSATGSNGKGAKARWELLARFTSYSYGKFIQRMSSVDPHCHAYFCSHVKWKILPCRSISPTPKNSCVLKILEFCNYCTSHIVVQTHIVSQREVVLEHAEDEYLVGVDLHRPPVGRLVREADGRTPNASGGIEHLAGRGQPYVLNEVRHVFLERRYIHWYWIEQEN